MDPAMLALHKRARLLARSPISVLLLGESGVGKEIFASLIHENSPRAEGPFVAINCSAIASTLLENELFGHAKDAFTGAKTAYKGSFEQAHGGTLFIDEVGEIPAFTQVKLLRALQDREVKPIGSEVPRQVDVRFIFATNRDLFAAVQNEEFRKDFYYRLKGATISIPPLRDRRQEIEPLTKYFMEREASRIPGCALPKISKEALATLLAYDWPGNIRELRNVVEQAVALCEGGIVQREHLEFEPTHPTAHVRADKLHDSSPKTRTALASIRNGLANLAVLRPGNSNKTDQVRILQIFKKEGCVDRNFYLLCADLRRHQIEQPELLDLVPGWICELFYQQRPTLRNAQRASEPPMVADPTSAHPPSSSSPPSISVSALNAVTQVRLSRARQKRMPDTLYVKRRVEQDIDSFLTSSEDLFVLADVAGAGKTVIVARSAERFMQMGHTVLLIRGADIPTEPPASPSAQSPMCDSLIEQTILGHYGGCFTANEPEGTQSARDPADLWRRFAHRSTIVILDAINEYQGARSALQQSLSALLERISGLSIKLLLTCRFEDWSSGDRGASAMINLELLYDRLYKAGGDAARFGSARLSEGELGHFSEPEFKEAWDRYAAHYRISGEPIGDARRSLQRPLFLWFFCEASRGQSPSRFAHVRSWDVLRGYAAHAREAIASTLRHENPSGVGAHGELLEDVDGLVDHCLSGVAWEMLTKRRVWIDESTMHEMFHRLISSYPDSRKMAGAQTPMQTAKVLLHGFHVQSILHARPREGRTEYKFSFELFQEYCCGRYLSAIPLLFHGEPARELLFLEQFHGAGHVRSAEVLRYAVIEREARSNDYVNLLEWLAKGHPDFQEAACQAIPELVAVRGISPGARSYVTAKADLEIRGSARFQRLGFVAEGEHSSAGAVARARGREIQRIFEHVLDKILDKKDFTIRFAVRSTIDGMIEQQPTIMWPLIEQWCQQGQSFLKRTVGIAAIPAFGAAHQQGVRRLVELFRSPGEPEFWVRRSVAEAMVELIRRVAQTAVVARSLVASNAPAMDACDEFQSALSEAVARTMDDIERAMLIDKLIFLSATRLSCPYSILEKKLDEPALSWTIISCLRAIRAVRTDWVLSARHADEEADKLGPGATDSKASEFLRARAGILRAKVTELNQWVHARRFPQKLEQDWNNSTSWARRQAITGLVDAITANDAADHLTPRNDAGGDGDEPLGGMKRALVAVVFSPEYFSGSFHDHPECRERIYAVLDRLDTCRSESGRMFDYKGAARAEEEDLIGRRYDGKTLHDPAYVDLVRSTSEQMKRGSFYWQSFRDLEIRPGSWQAASRSAGALMRGLDLVLSGEYRAVLCPSRPPGHLAGNRICIFDNIGVAIRRAQQHGDLRVFIFDADAHHGRHLQQSFYDDLGVFYCSIHETNVHPGEGFVDQIGSASGESAELDGFELDGLGTTLNIPIDSQVTAAAYVEIVRKYVIPAARRFAPDVIFIAGGVDGDELDPFANLRLDPSCFHFAAKELEQVAKRGIVVSLEGGYDLSRGLPDGMEAYLWGVIKAGLPERLERPPSSPDPESTAARERAWPAREVGVIEVLRCYDRAIKIDELCVVGSVERVLSASVEPRDMLKIPDRVRYGIGAGSLAETHYAASESVGELIVANGRRACTRPLRAVEIDVGHDVLTPFFVGWERAPEIVLRMTLGGVVSVGALLEQLSRAIECPAPVLGLVGYVEIAPGDLAEKRLIASPTSARRAGRDADGSDGGPLCLSPEAFHEFFASTHPRGGLLALVVGIVVRVGHPSWTSAGTERAFTEATTYRKKTGTATREVINHLHFAEVSRPEVAPWGVDDLDSIRERFADSLRSAPSFVGHLDASTRVSQAVLGVVPLRPEAGWIPSRRNR
jgi:transcriptional regulator with AAA-type ATPase domain/acetoin utilization deacetylase AcuC-like enzyme